MSAVVAPAHGGEEPDDAPGEARSPRESPEPSASVACEPSRRAWEAAIRAPAAVVPAPPAWRARSLSRVSAKKLSDGVLVRRISRSIGGESTLASTRAAAGVRPARAFRRTVTPRASSASSRRAAAKAGGFAWKAPAALGEEAAVVGQSAQRPNPGRHPVARVRASAKRVECGLVPVDPPGHALDPDVLEQCSEILHRRAATVRPARKAAAAKGRVAAALQVEAAPEHSLGAELPRAEHLRAKPALGPEAGQGGAGGEQLRVRGEDAGGALAPAEYRTRRLLAAHIHHICAGIGAGSAHVAGQALHQ